MYNLKTLAAFLISGMTVSGAAATEPVFRLDMEPASGSVIESVSNTRYTINGIHRGEATTGYTGSGKATRFDGYSTYVEGDVNDILSANRRRATFSVWVAPETYPMIAMRQTVPDRIPLFGIYNNGNDVAIEMGQNGEYFFVCTIGGQKAEAHYKNPLPCNMWSQITGVVDGNAGLIRMYYNDELVSETPCARGNISFTGGKMFIGRGQQAVADGPFGLNYFNGIIDDITVYNDLVAPGAVTFNPLTISVPPSRFEGDILRPTYHCMPSANWTNEPHGLIYHGGKYHIFHQRNANGTYMGRQHWGHLVSENLYDWTEAPVALFPGKDGADLWGCWSGCVVNDPAWNGGVPQIFYTSVDYARASVSRADVADINDPDLVKWNKTGVVIPNTPGGFDDFRDMFVFNNDGKWYMVIGCGRGGKGCLVLSRYENGAWTNDGTIFFKEDDQPLGNFWEMPTVTKIDGKWVLTISTINNGDNNTYYWIGNINDDGTFTATTGVRKVEMEGMARNGYGMMSPSLLQKDGKTIAIGIVPDKLPSGEDVKKGWSHTFSLPREWHVSDDNYLTQRPYSGLEAMRGANMVTNPAGAQALHVNGRQFEASATFTAPASGRFGFNIFKSGDKNVGVYYDMSSSKFCVDASRCDRLITDGADAVSPGGVFSSPLPKPIAAGEKVKIQLFVDNSVIDVFVNDMWASSVRVFSTNPAAAGTEVFADGGAVIDNVEAYNLNVRGYIGGLELKQEGFAAAEPIEPAEEVYLDPTGRYEVDATGRDVKLKKMDKMKMGILLRGDAPTLNPHEKAALDYFVRECPDGKVFTDATSGDILTDDDLKVIWVHVDADGDASIPFSTSTIDNLAAWVKKGGNLYLSGFATQLVEKIGRTTGHAPNEINLNGGDNPDIWTINAVMEDPDSHYLLNGLDLLDGKPIPNYPVIGGLNQGDRTYRMDHNCLWFLERMYGGKDWRNPDSNNQFEEETSSRVLATWGRDEYNYGNAGIVEFYPVGDWQGTIVANGIAGANQFVHQNGDNQWDYNQKRLLNNILVSLHGPVDPDESTTGIGDIDADSYLAPIVETRGGIITYRNVEPSSVMTVSDLRGRVIASIAIGGDGSVNLPLGGFIIARVVSPDNKMATFKLYVK